MIDNAPDDLTPEELHADSVGSYYEAIRAIGLAVARGERPLPECFIPRDRRESTIR